MSNSIDTLFPWLQPKKPALDLLDLSFLAPPKPPAFSFLDLIPLPPAAPPGALAMLFEDPTKKDITLSDDINTEIHSILATSWKEREGRNVPEAEDIKLGNDAVKLNATVLYADLADSTNLVDSHLASFAAETFKSFLVCACKVIRSNEGTITSFDGDRVMAVFIGESKNTSAVKCALQINYAVKAILIPKVRSFYSQSRSTFDLAHAVGVDTGSLFVARTGIRGANDLVWVGGSANWAAKMSALREGGYSSWISGAVFDNMHKSVKLGSDGRMMWEQRLLNGKTLYRSSWWWPI